MKRAFIVFALFLSAMGSSAAEKETGAVVDLGGGDVRSLEQVVAFHGTDFMKREVVMVVFTNMPLDKAAIAAAADGKKEVDRQRYKGPEAKRDVLFILLHKGNVHSYSLSFSLPGSSLNAGGQVKGEVLSLTGTRVQGEVPKQETSKRADAITLSAIFDVEILE